jgi:hypothetical protein
MSQLGPSSADTAAVVATAARHARRGEESGAPDLGANPPMSAVTRPHPTVPRARARGHPAGSAQPAPISATAVAARLVR